MTIKYFTHCASQGAGVQEPWSRSHTVSWGQQCCMSAQHTASPPRGQQPHSPPPSWQQVWSSSQV